MEEIVFPNQIRMYRKMRGVSMQALADHLSVSLSAVSKVEKGYRRVDQDQLIRIAEHLDCSMQDLFVNEQNSSSEVVITWRREQERRNQTNEKSGLKALGAGLRHIRTEKDLTLIEVAENSGMTLSVYHRIEMGQREVSKKEYASMAKALKMNETDLKTEIEKLNSSGVLKEIILKNDAKHKILNDSRIASINFSHNSEICVYGTAGKDGDIVIDIENETKRIERPSILKDKPESYAVNLCTRRLGSLLPSRSILFVDPSETASIGDIALYYRDEEIASIVSIRESEDGKLYGRRWNPDEKIEIDNEGLEKLHKVVCIIL